jgi:hypothetical protein
MVLSKGDEPDELDDADKQLPVTQLRKALVEGNVFLDQIADRAFCVSHMVTCERKALPPGKWQLEFVADGYEGVLVDVTALKEDELSDAEGDADDVELCSHDIDEFLRKQLYVADTGERFVVFGSLAHQRYSLDVNLARYMQADMFVKVGSTSARGQLPITVMQLQRPCNQRIYVSLPGVYAFLGLTTYRGHAAEWIRADRWHKIIASFGLGDSHIIKSTHGSTMVKKGSCYEAFYERCLPWPGIALVALILLALHWGTADSSLGGFVSDIDRRSSLLMVESFCAEAAICKQPDLVLLFDVDWVCNWPRGEPGLLSCRLDLNMEAGMFPLSVFVEFAEEAGGFAQRCLESLCLGGMDRTCETISVFELLKTCVRMKLRPLVGQICLWLSKVLELGFADQGAVRHIKKKLPDESTRPILFKTREWGDLVAYGGLDMRLAQYVLAGVEESSKHNVFSIAVDKSNPARGTIANGFIAFPNNVGLLCTPGVRAVQL